MWESTPWVVGGGAEHSPEVARLLAYAATSGAEGIVGITDLKVQALATPGTSVRVALGAALIRNRYAGGGQQTYAVRNTAQHTRAITATGSGSGRSDLVVARVTDPQYGGPIPPDPTSHQYVDTHVIVGVPPNTETARELNLGYPAIALARIDIPASTATITNAMITDLRKVALPRSYRVLFAWNPTMSDNVEHTLTSTATYPSGQVWPHMRDNVGYWFVDIPEWATHANVLGTWGGVKVAKATARGWLWIQLGAIPGWGERVSTQGTLWTLADSGSGRESWHAADDIVIPAAMRGTRDAIRLMGNRLSGSGGPTIDDASSISVDIQFTEGPA